MGINLYTDRYEDKRYKFEGFYPSILWELRRGYITLHKRCISYDQCALLVTVGVMGFAPRFRPLARYLLLNPKPNTQT